MAIRTDPVCGQHVDESDAYARGLHSSYMMRRYSFCSADCKAKFDQDPRPYVFTTDIICGREVHMDDAEGQGLYADHNGKRLYFCSQQCRAKFEVNPDSPPTLDATEHRHSAGAEGAIAE